MDNGTCQAGELRCEMHTRSGPVVQLSVAGELGDSGLMGEGKSKLAWMSDMEGLCLSLKQISLKKMILGAKWRSEVVEPGGGW